MARSGLRNPADFSEIIGFTASEAEAMSGLAAPYLLFIVDEASGVEDPIFEAIEGNRAAGARLFIIGNPTQASGEFYRAFHSKRDLYHCIHIDSRDSPNVTGKEAAIPGLAGREWVAEKIREWGEDSALFNIRVAGKFVVAEEARVFPLGMLAASQERWEQAIDDPAAVLWIGLDPAGEGDGGDESAFCARRGSRVRELRTYRGLTPEAHVALVEDMIPAGCPRTIVLVDAEGETGARVWSAIRERSERRPCPFEPVRVRSSEKAVRHPMIYDRVRDELYANARDWVKAGGAIPENAKLELDLHAAEFLAGPLGRLKLLPKREFRSRLGRSPDLGDAFALSCWEPLSMREATIARPQPRTDIQAEMAHPIIDPYSSGINPWT
jgi:hypothetical protein